MQGPKTWWTVKGNGYISGPCVKSEDSPQHESTASLGLRSINDTEVTLLMMSLLLLFRAHSALSWLCFASIASNSGPMAALSSKPQPVSIVLCVWGTWVQVPWVASFLHAQRALPLKLTVTSSLRKPQRRWAGDAQSCVLPRGTPMGNGHGVLHIPTPLCNNSLLPNIPPFSQGLHHCQCGNWRGMRDSSRLFQGQK